VSAWKSRGSLGLPAITLAAAFALLVGCSGVPTLPDRAGPRASESLVLSTLARDLEGWRTLRATVEGLSPQGSFSGAIFVDRERRAFRLYTWKLGGAIPIFDLLVREGELRLLVPQKRKLLVRPIDDSRLDSGPNAVTHSSSLRLEALVRAVLGTSGDVTRAVRDGAPASSSQRADEQAAWSVTETRAGIPCALYTIEPRTLAVRRQEILDGDGRTVLTIDYADHTPIAHGRIAPRRLIVSRPLDPPDRSLMLHFDDLVFDAPLDESKFEMRLPDETVQVKSLEEMGLE
jgi:hypothetical protein